jgi:hypothetical protein
MKSSTQRTRTYELEIRITWSLESIDAWDREFRWVIEHWSGTHRIWRSICIHISYLMM